MIIKNKILPVGKKFYALNLFGVIFAKGDCNEIIINHEKIHSYQMLELLILPFYLWYVLEWFWKFLYFKNYYEAYRNISFEKEAYINQGKKDYITKRKAFSFINYI